MTKQEIFDNELELPKENNVIQVWKAGSTFYEV